MFISGILFLNLFLNFYPYVFVVRNDNIHHGSWDMYITDLNSFYFCFSSPSFGPFPFAKDLFHLMFPDSNCPWVIETTESKTLWQLYAGTWMCYQKPPSTGEANLQHWQCFSLTSSLWYFTNVPSPTKMNFIPRLLGAGALLLLTGLT